LTGRRIPFRVTKNGRPVREVSVRGSINTGITYGIDFLGLEAAVAAGLDIWKWEQRLYPKWFMVRVVAWYNIRNKVHMIEEAAVAAKVKSKS
jgi:hypothetical protein